MLIPIRCFTCGKVSFPPFCSAARTAVHKHSCAQYAHWWLYALSFLQVIGNKYETYMQHLLEGKDPA